MKYIALLIAMVSFVAFFACTEPSTLDGTANWSDLSAGWEDSVQYRAGDDKAIELAKFDQQYVTDRNPKEQTGAGTVKVTICFVPPGNPDNKHTITVGAPAVDTLLENGSFLGPCPIDEGGWELDWETEEGETPYTCSAETVVEFIQGPRSDGSDVADDRSVVEKALGLAQDNDTINFVALGFGGSLTVSFDGRLINNEGNDVRIVETSYGSPACDAYPEYARVYASQDGNTWTEIGFGCLDMELDLGNLEWARYIKVVDETNGDGFSAVVDGYDVDAIEAICIPEPDDGGGDMDDVIPDDGTACDDLSELPLQISVRYLNPTAGYYQGYPNYYMGTNATYQVVLKNMSDEVLHHIEIAALFEYYPNGQILAGDPIQVWNEVTIPPNGTLILDDTYFLDYANVPTWFQTHVIVRRFNGACIDGATVFDNPSLGIIYDPLPEE